MKKVISVMALVFCALSINAQILRTEELEDYAKEKYALIPQHYYKIFFLST